MNNACSQLGCACIVSRSRGRSFSMRVGPAKVIPFGDTNVTKNRKMKNRRKIERSLNVLNESYGSLVKHFSCCGFNY
ncbi:hypothetical protein V1477_016456 [Vespula maculifrons]|uniref:Uncharacterized protein n=1 Tax=Vespula maculifrons TaxID=7453 RepID=A0ABD2B975_VESMC